MFKEDAEKQIKEVYPYRLELHAHTSPASRCSQVKPEDVVTIFHNAGYDGIAITNHFFPRPEIPDFLDIYRSDYLNRRQARHEGLSRRRAEISEPKR